MILRNTPVASRGDVLALVELACRAPSVHNTQPWRWRATSRSIEVRADRSRQLSSSDPDGRNLVISCGAALHHLLVAAAGMGIGTVARRNPDPRDPDLLAVVELKDATVVSPTDTELLVALKRRVTDRRRFTNWPVPDERLTPLAEVVEGPGTRVSVHASPSDRARLEALVDTARDVQREDPGCLREQQQWVGQSRLHDGVPAMSLPPQLHRDERRDRFERMAQGEHTSPEKPSGVVLAVCTPHDDTSAWLQAGEVLSAIWLRATVEGLSVVPLSQVIEVEATRRALRHELCAGAGHPQLVLRVGWQELIRPPMTRTPRRPLTEVLVP